MTDRERLEHVARSEHEMVTCSECGAAVCPFEGCPLPGHEDGCELDDGRWTCSRECWEKATIEPAGGSSEPPCPTCGHGMELQRVCEQCGHRIGAPAEEPECAGPFVDARDCPRHRGDVLNARVATPAEEALPILHEQRADGVWVCCCGDHLGAPVVECSPCPNTLSGVHWRWETDEGGVVRCASCYMAGRVVPLPAAPEEEK